MKFLLTIILCVVLTSIAGAAHFDFDTTDGNCSILISECYLLNGSWEPDDEIAVFTADGICGGATVVRGFPLGIAAWSDDNLTREVVEGFHTGDSIYYKRWDASLEEEISLQELYLLSGDSSWQSNGLIIVELADIEPHYDLHPTSIRHRFTCSSAVFAEGDILIGPRAGDQAAIITTGGEVGGLMVWHSMDSASGWAYRDEPATDELVEGFELGEAFAFTYWSQTYGMEFENIEVEFVQGDQVFVRNGNSDVALFALSIGEERNHPAPVSFHLSQATPNPFNGATVIDVSLPYFTPVTMTIFDVNGRIAGKNFQGDFSPGDHKIAINLFDYPTGNYICRIETSKEFGDIPLTLIR